MLACSNNPKQIHIKEPSQKTGPDIYNVSLNVLKVLEKEKEEATTPGIERDTSHATQSIPESLRKIINEELALETAGSEPEDSLEPPHQMVLGMGSANLKETSSVLSMDQSTFYYTLFLSSFTTLHDFILTLNVAHIKCPKGVVIFCKMVKTREFILKVILKH